MLSDVTYQSYARTVWSVAGSVGAVLLRQCLPCLCDDRQGMGSGQRFLGVSRINS